MKDKRAGSPKFEHIAGDVQPDRDDGLHWLRCVDCGELWAERDSGSFAKGKRYCANPEGGVK